MPDARYQIGQPNIGSPCRRVIDPLRKTELRSRRIYRLDLTVGMLAVRRSRLLQNRLPHLLVFDSSRFPGFSVRGIWKLLKHGNGFVQSLRREREVASKIIQENSIPE